MKDKRDDLIMALAEKLYICSRLLTAAAEGLEWDNKTVIFLMQQLRGTIKKEIHHDHIQSD